MSDTAETLSNHGSPEPQMVSNVLEANPSIQIKLEPIEVAIRKERTRLQDIEFDSGKQPSTWLLQYMVNERARGITGWPLNL